MSVLSAAYKAQLASLLAAEKDLSALKSALKELGADAALMGASMLPPPAGTAADIASLAVSLGRGDWGGALWDVVGLIPIVGDGAKAVGKGAKVANRMKDLEKAIAKAEKVLAKKQDDLSRLCKNSRVGKDKTTQAARHSSCVDCSAGGGKGGIIGRGKNKPDLTNKQKGELGEAAARKTLKRAGYEEIPARLPRNNGIDGVFVKKDANGEITDIIVSESKYSSTGKARMSDTKNMGRQMSDKWIKENIRKMQLSKDPEVRKTARILKRNEELIRKKANVLDPNGNNRWNKIKIPE